jgi:hypothetical protein
MDLLDRLVIAFDRRQRRRLGIWEFSDDPRCVFRIALTTARVGVKLADGTVVRAGDRTGAFHLWNEQVPRIPSTGPDLTWARTASQALDHSFRLMARHVAANAVFEEVQALGGTFTVPPSGARLLARAGVEIHDPGTPRSLMEWVEDRAMRIWVWLLRRAFNPESVRGLRLRDFQRRRLWLSKRTLLALYGSRDAGAHGR